ncbi:MAG: TRAP transporter small permease [Pirellulales bacterium]|nr:TRAP transporter small permease [Pirellulales bacterium]
MWKHILKLRAILVRLLEMVVIIAMAFLVLDVLWGVFTRFLLRSPSRWTEEVATILLVWVSLLGAAVAFGRREHLGMDYLVKQLSLDGQQLTELAVQLIVICFSAAALVWGGFELVSRTLASGQLTPALGLKMGYVYLAVPVSGAFIVLFSMEQIGEIFSGRSADHVDSESREVN